MRTDFGSFKTYLLATAVSVAATGAFAADMRAPVYKAAPAPVVAMYDWSGFYIGAQGGWSKADFDHTFNTAGHYNFAAGDTFDYSKSGGLLGGQIGYNWQAAQWVFGIEGSIAKTWLQSSAQISPFFPSTDTFQSEVEWIGTVTGRVGYAWNNVLGYVKGGWAYARLNDYVQDNSDFVDSTRSKSGWTVGGGVEFGLAPNWTFAVEYNYYDFSTTINEVSTNFSGGTFSPGTDHNFDVAVQSVIAKLSYKWGAAGPVLAKY